MQIEPSFVKYSVPSAVADAQRVSVVIPAYNSSAYLSATLQSIFDQSIRAREVIVVDDGSTDNTADIARSFGATVISLSNSGPAAARNVGIGVATGEYIAFMDADDLWAPEKLAMQVAALRSFAKPAFSFTDFRVFDEQGIHERSSGLRHHPAFRKIAKAAVAIEGSKSILIAADGSDPVLYDSYIQPSSVMVRRADVLAVGGFDESLRVYEDHEFFLRLFKIAPAIGIMTSLLFYRRHSAQATADQTSMKLGLFDLSRRVAAAPDRYPRGDADYIANTEYLRYYRLGIEQARAARFDDAAKSFKSSVSHRWTPMANLGLLGSRICRSAGGRFAFRFTRALWKRRPSPR